MQRKLFLQLIGILGALAVAISGFLPWLTIKFLDILEITRGIDDYDGWVALALGLIGLILLFYQPRLAIIPALFALGLAAYEWIDFSRSYADVRGMEDKGVVAELGIGLFVLPAGAILMGIASLLIKGNRG